MNDHSSKLFQLLSRSEIFKSSDIPSNAKAISINLDIGSLDISNGLEDLEIKNTVIKKTNKVIFLKTIITDNEKNNSQLTSVWSLNETI
jgi:hypothetical protein|tara:strand:+ start:762 stop:1028 length:267 start_codon:yes stop_codon:yes gene_type:complete